MSRERLRKGNDYPSVSFGVKTCDRSDRKINFVISCSNVIVCLFVFCLCFSYMFSIRLSFRNLIKQNCFHVQMKMTHVQPAMVQRNAHVQQAIQAFHAKVSFNT